MPKGPLLRTSRYMHLISVFSVCVCVCVSFDVLPKCIAVESFWGNPREPGINLRAEVKFYKPGVLVLHQGHCV